MLVRIYNPALNTANLQSAKQKFISGIINPKTHGTGL